MKQERKITKYKQEREGAVFLKFFINVIEKLDILEFQNGCNALTGTDIKPFQVDLDAATSQLF